MDADYYDRPQCTTTTSIANTMYYMMPFFGILAILPVDTKFSRPKFSIFSAKTLHRITQNLDYFSFQGTY